MLPAENSLLNSQNKTQQFQDNTLHLSEPVTYLDHGRGNQSGEHAPVDRRVHVPGLHGADKLMKRGLNRMKELRKTHQSLLVLRKPLSRMRPPPAVPRGPGAHFVCPPSLPHLPLQLMGAMTRRQHTGLKPARKDLYDTLTPEQRKIPKNRSVNNINKVFERRGEETSLTLRGDPTMRPCALNEAVQTMVRKEKYFGTNSVNRSQTLEPTHQKQDYFKLTQI